MKQKSRSILKKIKSFFQGMSAKYSEAQSLV